MGPAELVFRVPVLAWQVPIKLVPRDYPDLDAALASFRGYHRVFVIPPGRIPSEDLADYIPLKHGRTLYVFGRPGENLVRYVRPEDDVLSIATPGPTDMMAVSAAGIILYEHRQPHHH